MDRLTNFLALTMALSWVRLSIHFVLWSMTDDPENNFPLGRVWYFAIIYVIVPIPFLMVTIW